MDWVGLISASSISTIGEIIVAGAAVFVALSAKKGLDTWWRQMRGEDEYKLARDLLSSLYKYRDAVYDIRRPWTFIQVSGKHPDKNMEKTDEEKRIFNEILQKCERKWDTIVELRMHIYRDLVVSEALWGRELYVKFNELFKQAYMLRDAIHFYLKILNPDIPDDQAVDRKNPAAFGEKASAMRAIAFSEGDEDAFGDEIMREIKSIEQYLRQKGNLEVTSD